MEVFEYDDVMHHTRIAFSCGVEKTIRTRYDFDNRKKKILFQNIGISLNEAVT